MECVDNSTCTNSTQFAIEEMVVHDLYSEGNVRHDIALIRLAKDVPYTDFIRPICLPLSESIYKKFKDGLENHYYRPRLEERHVISNGC